MHGQQNIYIKKTHTRFVFTFFSKIAPFMKWCGKILESRADHRR